MLIVFEPGKYNEWRGKVSNAHEREEGEFAVKQANNMRHPSHRTVLLLLLLLDACYEPGSRCAARLQSLLHRAKVRGGVVGR